MCSFFNRKSVSFYFLNWKFLKKKKSNYDNAGGEVEINVLEKV